MNQLYDPQNGVMRVAAAMSGSGTNIRKLHDLEQRLRAVGNQSFEIVAIITDTPDPEECNSRKMAEEFGIPYFAADINLFYKGRGLDRAKVPLATKLDLLTEYYAPINAFLREMHVHTIAYGGFMNIVAEPLLSQYVNVNVHPADLSIVDERGIRKYRGDAAVKKAILAGETSLRASTHLMTAELDGGPVVLVSDPLEVDLLGQTLMYVKADRNFAQRVAAHNQNRLKEVGDWIIFPETVKLVAEGKVYVHDGAVVIQ